MILIGERVLLRAVEGHDNEMLRELINDPKTEYLVRGTSFPVSKEAQEKWYEKHTSDANTLRLVIATKDDDMTGLGTVVLTGIDLKNAVAEIHIKLLPKEQKKGYASDAVKTVLEYAFGELRLNCVFAEVLSYNFVSQKLFERCKFRREGLLRSRAYKRGEFVDAYSYSILKEEFLNEK